MSRGSGLGWLAIVAILVGAVVIALAVAAVTVQFLGGAWLGAYRTLAGVGGVGAGIIGLGLAAYAFD